jgi:uncharacterized membrane protein YuzA (DUF378 family)
MKGFNVIAAILSGLASVVIAYFVLRAAAVGRVLYKGKFIQKKKEPFHYWSSMAVWIIFSLAMLFYAVVGIFPQILPHSQK